MTYINTIYIVEQRGIRRASAIYYEELPALNTRSKIHAESTTLSRFLQMILIKDKEETCRQIQEANKDKKKLHKQVLLLFAFNQLEQRVFATCNFGLL